MSCAAPKCSSAVESRIRDWEQLGGDSECSDGRRFVACAGSGVICGIPVQHMREDSVTELDLSNRGLHVAAAMLVAYLLPAMSVLKNCNLLKNTFDIESATMLAKIGAERRIMLSGMTRDQRQANFWCKSLQPADAILIGSDLKSMAVLTYLQLYDNKIGTRVPMPSPRP